PIVKQMTPQPPPLPSRVLERRPEQLFWIVKHGIKYTAMPGWVALERDDEVWSMVAFLLQLPKLGPERYRQLAYGERIADLAGDEEGGDAVSYFFRPLTEPVQLIVA